MYDLLLRNGTVIDPAVGASVRRDVAVVGDRIVELADPPDPARQAIDVSGLYVVPGFIDLHVHVFPEFTHWGVEVDDSCLAHGTTTALDAGSSGAYTFPGFRKYVIEVSQTRLFALLNISAIGLVGDEAHLHTSGELDDLRHCDVKSALRVIEGNRDRIMGIKIRLSDTIADGGKNELPALCRAREAADAAGLPIMVHTPKSTLSIEQILAELRPGDVLTHCFHGHSCGIVAADLEVLPAVRRKVEEGLLLDVGHGMGSFTFEVARAALRQGVLPHTISSDLHRYNLHGPVFDLVTTMNKFLHLGLEVAEVVRRVSATAARFLKMDGEIGTLRPGAFADIVVLELTNKETRLTDAKGVTEIARQRLEPRFIFRAGRQVASRK